MTKRRHVLLTGLAAAVSSVAGTVRAQTTHTVVIRQFAFVPETLEVSVGDTVVWVNEDIVPHTATATNGDWDSDALNRGESWSHAVPAPGTVDYFCRFHPAMRARLIAN